MADVTVVERDKPTGSTIWHVTGLFVSEFLNSEADCEMYTHGRNLYANLEKTVLPTSTRDVGCMQIVNSTVRMQEMRRLAQFMHRHA